MFITPHHFAADESPHERSAAAIGFRVRRAARAAEQQRRRMEAGLALTADRPEASLRRVAAPSRRPQPAPCP